MLLAVVVALGCSESTAPPGADSDLEQPADAGAMEPPPLGDGAVMPPPALADAVVEPCAQYGGDADGDGICNAFDNCIGVENADQANTDGDGSGDACDAREPEQGPPVDACAGFGGDEDEDGVCQSRDNCPEASNVDQRDGDQDGWGDACDETPGPCDDHGGDADADTVCGDFDNCPLATNRNQLDRDFDGLGDVCDPSVIVDPSTDPCAGLGGDDDSDDVCGIYDNCPGTFNSDQGDADGDGDGDACEVEVCDGVDNDGDEDADQGFADRDGDAVADCVDPCPDTPNVDSDGDGLPDCGDVCPLDYLNDVDGDGVCGSDDNCMAYPNPTQSDRDGDGIGDHCDTEECDGISNDADAFVDEGLPNADGDGLCDSRDECPLDRLNDIDGDGVCGDEDNCPANLNPDQQNSDGDGHGDECDFDSGAACDPAAPLASPGAMAWPDTAIVNGVIADPVRNLIYATVAYNSPFHSDHVVAIYPDSRTVAWSVFVSGNPSALAISDDGSTLYVSTPSTNSVWILRPGTRQRCFDFLIGRTSFGDAANAVDLSVIPGAPETLVAATSARDARVFDRGVLREVTTGWSESITEVVAADATRAYGYNDSSTGFDFSELTIDSQGITVDWSDPYLVSGFEADIAHFEGRVYGSNGAIIDPSAPRIVARLAAVGPFALDTARREIFFLTSATNVDVFDIDSFAKLRSIVVSTGPGFGPRQLIRWGANGLVVRNAGALTFVAE